MADTLLIGGKGYIGSRLREYIDCDLAGEIRSYDNIILLAGYSSVAKCNNNPDGAWKNNVDFFREILHEIQPHQKFIYASSASVYNGIPSKVTEDTNLFKCTQMYDLTKHTIDSLAKLSGKQTYGLRFATVNGYSPILRVDVMLNKMVQDAKDRGIIEISNPLLRRPILAITDLCEGIAKILETPEDKRGIYNMASFTMTVEDMAERVAEEYDAEVKYLPDSPHYVFGVDTTKFEGAFNFRFNSTLESVLTDLKQEPKELVVRV